MPNRHRRGGASSMSSRSVAIQQRNEELERQIKEMQMKSKSSSSGSGAGSSLSSASLAVQQRNRELEKEVAELLETKSTLQIVCPSGSPAAGQLSSASAAVQKRNQELEQQLAVLELKLKRHGLGPSAPMMPTAIFHTAVRGHVQLKTGEERGTRTRELKQLLRKAQELDLAFIMDATASMTKYISTVKSLAPEIVVGVKKAFPQMKLRVGFAPYRDYGDYDTDDSQKCDFTESFDGPQSKFVRALARVNPIGNKDDAEDVFSGLERVATLSWSSKARVVIHVGDSPCHGSEFHDKHVSDNFPRGDVKGRDIGQLLKVLRHDCEIMYYLFCHITDRTKKMVKVFREKDAASHRGGKWIHEHRLTDMNEFLKVVISTSCECIAMSTRMVTEGGGPAVPKYVPISVKEEIPRWESVKPQQASLFKYMLPATLEDLFKIVDSNGSLKIEEMPASTVRIALHPFSEAGMIRWPYHALVHNQHMVVKRFKNPVGENVSKVHTREAYCQQMEVQTVAAFMAQHFNQELERFSNLQDYKTVQFATVSVLKVGSSTYYNLEKWLEGSWIRYTNNLNYVNTKDYAATLQAFSHWTHQRSKGRLMVTDLQGVQIRGSNGKNVFMLCDPAVHCRNAFRYEWTKTNWSTPGMDSFFETHRCNNICRSLGLQPKNGNFTSKGTGLV